MNDIQRLLAYEEIRQDESSEGPEVAIVGSYHARARNLIVAGTEPLWGALRGLLLGHEREGLAEHLAALPLAPGNDLSRTDEDAVVGHDVPLALRAGFASGSARSRRPLLGCASEPPAT